MGRDSRLNFMPRSQRQPLPKVGNVPIIGQQEPEVVLDSYGRPLMAGDGVALTLSRPPLFHVEKIQPLASEGGQPLPPNIMEVVLSSRLRFIMPRNQPQMEFLLAMPKDEMPQPQPDTLITPVTDDAESTTDGDPA